MAFITGLLLALASTAAVALPVRPNDNVKTAGRLEGNVLTVQLHTTHDIKSHAGMAGLVIGVEILYTKVATASDTAPVRRLSLVLTEEPNRYGNRTGYRAQIEGVDAPRLDAGPVPGPVMVLQRGEPVEMHDEAQLAGGIYGALLVMEPGERYDPAIDHVVIIGLNGVLVNGTREPFALNGRASPAPISMRAGMPNRLRLINITPNNVALTVFLVDQFETVRWKLLAKDGASVPTAQSEPRVARQQIAVGETYDFEIDGTRPRGLWLEMRRGNGEWVLQAP